MKMINQINIDSSVGKWFKKERRFSIPQNNHRNVGVIKKYSNHDPESHNKNNNL